MAATIVVVVCLLCFVVFVIFCFEFFMSTGWMPWH